MSRRSVLTRISHFPIKMTNLDILLCKIESDLLFPLEISRCNLLSHQFKSYLSQMHELS